MAKAEEEADSDGEESIAQPGESPSQAQQKKKTGKKPKKSRRVVSFNHENDCDDFVPGDESDDDQEVPMKDAAEHKLAQKAKPADKSDVTGEPSTEGSNASSDGASKTNNKNAKSTSKKTSKSQTKTKSSDKTPATPTKKPNSSATVGRLTRTQRRKINRAKKFEKLAGGKPISNSEC